MKTFTYIPLYHFYFKYLGLLLSLVGTGLLFFVNPVYQMMLYAGLLIMVFSKEKSENEEIASVRAEVFKTTFGFTIALSLALHLTEVISDDFVLEMSPIRSIGLPLLFYLALFYLSLMLKINVDSSQSLSENLRHHRRFYVIIFICILITTCLLIIGIYH